MAMKRKSWDQASYDALVKFAEQGGKIRSVKADRKLIKRDTWQGGKITQGFELRALTDHGNDGK